MRSTRRLSLVVFLAALGWIALGLLRPLELYDEGIVLVGALRTAGGEVPLKDFYAVYMPGHVHLLAGLFAVFGPSVLLNRLLSVLTRAALVAVCFVLLRKLDEAPLRFAVAVSVVLTAWTGFFGIFGYAATSGLLLGLLSGLCSMRAADRWVSGGGGGTSHVSALQWMMAAGALAGAATLLRQDIGPMVILAQVLFLGFVLVWPGPAGGPGPVRAFGVVVLAFAGGVLAVIVVPALFYLSHLSPGELVASLLLWPAELIGEYRWLPYPNVLRYPVALVGGQHSVVEVLLAFATELPFLLPLLVFPLVAFEIVRAIRERHDTDRAALRFLLLVFGVLLLNQVRGRSDGVHAAPSFVMALVLLPGLWRRLVPRRWPVRLKTVLGAVGLYLLLVAPVGAVLLQTASLLSTRPDTSVGVHPPRARGVRLDPDQAKAVAYVQRRTGPEEPVFVGNTRHDRVLWNDVSFYFLLERPIPTRYHAFDPGLTTTDSVQRTIIQDLERHRVRYIVRYSGSEQLSEPNRSREIGATRLDEYLARTFPTEQQRFGRYRISSR